MTQPVTRDSLTVTVPDDDRNRVDDFDSSNVII
jgi:hypothetical protein